MNSVHFQTDKRKLKNDEIDLLIEDVSKVPQLIAGDGRRWKRFDLFYIAIRNNSLIGVCAVVRLKNWIKLGPFVILERYRNKGYGKRIINEIVKDYASKNIFIGSPTPAVWRIALNLGFQQTNFIDVPGEIKKYLIMQTLVSAFNFSIVKEFIRKSFRRKDKYLCFIKRIK